MGEVDKTEVYLRYLPRSATEEQIRELVKGCGTIKRVWIGKDRDTGECKGFAFVNFSKNREARECVLRCNEHPRNYLDGKHVVFEHAKAWEGNTKPEKSSERDGGGGGGGGGGSRASGGRGDAKSSENGNKVHDGKVRKKVHSKNRLGAKARQRAKKRAAKEAAGGGDCPNEHSLVVAAPKSTSVRVL